MKIAVFSDIHGNYTALQKVLAETKLMDIEQIFILGDLVGYYYEVEKVLQCLQNINTSIIAGNHERLLTEYINNKKTRHVITKKYGNSYQMISDKKKIVNMLINLPDKLSVTRNGVNFLLCHGSPWNQDAYVYPDCDFKDMEKCDIRDYHFVLMGHTHYPFAFKGKYSFIVNPGSIGQNRQKGGIANWGIINTLNQTYIQMSTPYGTSEVEEMVGKYDPKNEYLREVLRRNNSL